MHKDHNLQSTDAHCQLGYHLGDGAAYFRAGISMTRWAVLAEGLWNKESDCTCQQTMAPEEHTPGEVSHGTWRNEHISEGHEHHKGSQGSSDHPQGRRNGFTCPATDNTYGKADFNPCQGNNF